jgi:hypothetical protein
MPPSSNALSSPMRPAAHLADAGLLQRVGPVQEELRMAKSGDVIDGSPLPVTIRSPVRIPFPILPAASSFVSKR